VPLVSVGQLPADGVTQQGKGGSGANDHTFFGQFEGNTSVYAALRYGF